MATTVDEIEFKYEVPAGTVLPPLEDLPRVAAESDPDEQNLEADYYDTPDLRLIRAGITLRRRRGGSDPGWHLKLPVGGNSRREIQVPLSHGGAAGSGGSGGSDVPDELAALVRVHTRGEPLVPVAIIRTRRRRRLLLDRAGTSLAELVADEVSAETLGESTTISSWDEVEVELTGGGRKLLEAADERLRHSGLRRARRTAKLERALTGQIPEPGPRHMLTRHSPAGDVVLAYLGSQVDAVKSMDPMVRRDEPDAVHQMRVATRRLRSTLQAFGKVLRRRDTQALSAELKWLGGVLGEARDAEVLDARMERRARETPAELLLGPVQARIQGHFAALKAAARTSLLEALDSQRYFALLDGLDRLLADPPVTAKARKPAGHVLPAMNARAYRRLARRMRYIPRAPSSNARDAALHEARKAAKRARYAAEAVSPALGGQARRFAKRMKALQSVLGDHQDTVVARRVDRELGVSAHLAGENVFSYGLLYERDANEALHLQEEARQVWKRSSRPRYRRWM
jgi:CHAD domain-containing protein